MSISERLNELYTVGRDAIRSRIACTLLPYESALKTISELTKRYDYVSVRGYLPGYGDFSALGSELRSPSRIGKNAELPVVGMDASPFDGHINLGYLEKPSRHAVEITKTGGGEDAEFTAELKNPVYSDVTILDDLKDRNEGRIRLSKIKFSNDPAAIK